jgi:hypothetical protein
VRDAIISSTYLRAENVEHSFLINLHSLIPTITYGQYIYINFPGIYSDALKDFTPDCSITREN